MWCEGSFEVDDCMEGMKLEYLRPWDLMIEGIYEAKPGQDI